MKRSKTTERRRAASRSAGLLLALVLLLPASAAQALDICGCAGSPSSLGAWDSTTDPASWPFITRSEYDANGDLQVVSRQISLNGSTITIPLPDDGVLIFDSFLLDGPGTPGNAILVFSRNVANTPVTLLVAGDFAVRGGDTISLAGSHGSFGFNNLPGLGGLGGPGGFKGGDGGYNLAGFPLGGAGHGPGGAAPGVLGASGHVNPFRTGGNGGSWIGSADLLPLNGGSGGGGASSDSTSTLGANGAGGGGGGAILVAADGTITIDGQISVRGGNGGNGANNSHSFGGGGGSGGAIRLVAEAVVGSTAGTLEARGGNAGGFANGGGIGRVRLESLGSSFPGNRAFPFATYVDAPGPVVLPFSPSIAIAAVGGAGLAPPLGGWRHTTDSNKIDVILGAPGDTTVQLATSGVPLNTLVRVSAVPYRGAPKTTVDVAIDSCDANGIDCTASATFNLDPGGYAIEARATFQPAP